MSHLLLNKNMITEIMESNLSELDKDSKLIDLYASKKIKGQEETKRNTYYWFIEKYPGMCSGFTLLLLMNHAL